MSRPALPPRLQIERLGAWEWREDDPPGRAAMSADPLSEVLIRPTAQES